MKLRPISPFVQEEFSKYEKLRRIYMSEGHFLNQFLWEHYYKTRYAVDELALYLFFKKGEIRGAFAPLCREEDLPLVFDRIVDFQHEKYGRKARLFLCDSRMVEILKENGRLEGFTTEPDRDCFDYIYEAEKLRTLSGKALHKKKNLVNRFLREYEGHFEYQTLGPENINEIAACHQKWLDERRIYDKYNCIDDEEEGIYRLFGNCRIIQCKMGGVRIDGELKAFAIGSYAPDIQCAFVHVEKADASYIGLYNYINQQFILNEFPDAVLVNREDDLGQENLRQAKMTYRPLRLEEKFTIQER